MADTPVRHPGPVAAPRGRGRASWREWPLGARVVVRRHLPEGGYSDSVGILLERTDELVRLRTRHGEVTIPADLIAIGKLIDLPPA